MSKTHGSHPPRQQSSPFGRAGGSGRGSRSTGGCTSVTLQQLESRRSLVPDSPALLRLGDLLATAPLELRRDVVVDPLLVPPLDGQDRDSIEIDAVVQVIARGEAGFAGLADDLALGDGIADLHLDRAQVSVQTEEPEAVVEDDGVA